MLLDDIWTGQCRRITIYGRRSCQPGSRASVLAAAVTRELRIKWHKRPTASWSTNEHLIKNSLLAMLLPFMVSWKLLHLRFVFPCQDCTKANHLQHKKVELVFYKDTYEFPVLVTAGWQWEMRFREGQSVLVLSPLSLSRSISRSINCVHCCYSFTRR